MTPGYLNFQYNENWIEQTGLMFKISNIFKPLVQSSNIPACRCKECKIIVIDDYYVK